MSYHPLTRTLAPLLFCLTVVCPCSSALAKNLVANGDFEQDQDHDGKPQYWTTSGRKEIHQTLTRVPGHAGKFSAQLQCTEYAGGTPDSHVMICQLGQIDIRRGQWYRMTFWAKGKDIAKQVCEVAISNTRPWRSSGVGGRFIPSSQWKRFEILKRATYDVPAETSRLQIYFQSTGTLWLDDIVLEPVEITRQLHPAIAVEGVRNPIPNSSFECGSAGWGSYSPSITTWAGNLNRLYGTIDKTTAFHGKTSLRVCIDEKSPPVFHWDYYDPAVQPIDGTLAAHVGWIPVQPGKSYLFSCYLKADSSDVPVRLMAYQEGSRRLEKTVHITTQWKRYELPITPGAKYLWCAAGPDLTKSSVEQATVWLDAFQLDSGKTPRPYAPRSATESSIATSRIGNIFTQPEQGITVDVYLWNGADTQQRLSGQLVITDFTDSEVVSKNVVAMVPAKSLKRVHLSGLLCDRLGFYRMTWKPANHQSAFPQELRCALVKPYAHEDSPFGMNHAYPWNFMLRLCDTAGLTWMRDWSAKWHTVEPAPGEWDFSKVDPQIDRILACKLNPLILLPFPSAPWCSAADKKKIREVLGKDDHRLSRSVVACPAKDPALFRNYVAHTIRRYRDRVKWFEIMNEPIYTTYAVPARFGYGMDDYLTILKNSYQTIKKIDPSLQVIGGIGVWPDSHWVQEFIDADGLKWCDIMDVHLYPTTISPELYEPGLVENWQKMKTRKQTKPIWLTEFGCYADDDPHITPGTIGDSAMSRSNWGSEQAASAAMVKSTAVFMTHGIRKIFFHAGTCGPINGSNGGGIFFEYGGTPRKMYAALSQLANMLGPAPQPKTTFGSKAALCHYLFDTHRGAVAVVWAAGDDREVSVRVPSSISVSNMMGNPLKGDAIMVKSMPLYFSATDARTLQTWLDRVVTP